MKSLKSILEGRNRSSTKYDGGYVNIKGFDEKGSEYNYNGRLARDHSHVLVRKGGKKVKIPNTYGSIGQMGPVNRKNKVDKENQYRKFREKYGSTPRSYDAPSRVSEDGEGGGAAPTNSVGGGHIAGLGVGIQGEPGRSSSKILRRKKFAGTEVFEVNSDYFHKCKMGKRKYTRYENYVGKDEIGEAIRQYAREDYKRPIIVQDEKTGHMVYLRYGGKHANHGRTT